MECEFGLNVVPNIVTCSCLNGMTVEELSFGCGYDELSFKAEAEGHCKTLLLKPNQVEPLAPNEFICDDTILCPLPSAGSSVADACLLCGDAIVFEYTCWKEGTEQVFDVYGCSSETDYNEFASLACATALGLEVDVPLPPYFVGVPWFCPDETTGTDTGDTETTGGVAVDCSVWDPSANITVSGSTVFLDEQFVAGLVADPSPLWFCDDARISSGSVFGWVVSGADTGDLLYELGLRNGDVPLILNDYWLLDPEEVLTAFIELWYVDTESEYELTVLRGTSLLQLDYSLSP